MERRTKREREIEREKGQIGQRGGGCALARARARTQGDGAQLSSQNQNRKQKTETHTAVRSKGKLAAEASGARRRPVAAARAAPPFDDAAAMCSRSRVVNTLRSMPSVCRYARAPLRSETTDTGAAPPIRCAPLTRFASSPTPKGVKSVSPGLLPARCSGERESSPRYEEYGEGRLGDEEITSQLVSGGFA